MPDKHLHHIYSSPVQHHLIRSEPNKLLLQPDLSLLNSPLLLLLLPPFSPLPNALSTPRPLLLPAPIVDKPAAYQSTPLARPIHLALLTAYPEQNRDAPNVYPKHRQKQPIPPTTQGRAAGPLHLTSLSSHFHHSRT